MLLLIGWIHGKWGGVFSREKWDCKGYAQQTLEFIKGVKGGFVVWGWSGQHTKDGAEGISGSDMREMASPIYRADQR